MLYPIIVSPDFLLRIKDDDELCGKFNKFLTKFSEYWNDIFILIDDERDTFKNQYKKIKEDHGHESYDLSIICDLLINSNKSKIIKIDKEFGNDNEIIEYLKKKRVDNLIVFPDYFENEYITLKKTLHKFLLSSLTDEEAIKKIISVTRFSKNIVLIDPNVADALTNMSKIHDREHKNDCTQIKSKLIDNNNDLFYSLNRLIKAIYNSNIFIDKSQIKIQIRTTLNHTKLKHFKLPIIDEHNKWKLFNNAKDKGENYFFWPLKKGKSTHKTKKYETLDDGQNLYSLIKKDFNENDVEYEKKKRNSKILKVDNLSKINEKKEKFELIGNLLKSNIEQCTSGILKNIKPTITIHEHYKNVQPGETEQDIYFRHILAVDLRSSIELRKRLDIFSAKTGRLKNINSWYLKLEASPDEKKSAFNIFKHNAFQPEKISFN